MSSTESTSMDDYSDTEYYTEDENYDSRDGSELMASSGNMPDLFTVRTGECPGEYERIELLIKHSKVLKSGGISEEEKAALFSHMVVRSEAEGIEAEPWITSFFSVLQYPAVRSMLPSKVASAIGQLPDHETLDVLISFRFSNVPEEIVYEMYESFPGAHMHKKDQKVLLLSLEKPVQKEEEAEIKRVFPAFKFQGSGKLFPVHTEEIFLILNAEKPLFSCLVHDDTAIKGYILDRERFIAFIEAMKKYYT
ncbi:hypothetical protein NERG_00561 [Nematocida ausubeli]|uniref:Protein BCP1 n=1 Tax=Nematocida ausubeli (strain ATCC PRA-371 / ERTm2) TaxID=1913371 RepID=H8ZAE0_NEMA1|nr:hypothetical protein NERG_00561 [Nematocida ausubeli]